MATTWIKSLHVNKGKTIAQTLADRTDYAENPNKTERGLFVTGFACDPRTADEQFFIAKRKYEYITGRNQGKHNVLAYHIRQSFKPGEIDAETANKLGYELAQRFFKGKHAFIVATHVDKHHIHNHIIVNSTTLDCERKFKDFKRSDRAVRRLSDMLCVEYGLSVIENPKPSRGSYADWLGDDKKPSHKGDLRRLFDEAAPVVSTFEDFIAKLRERGCIVSTKRKKPSFIAPGWKKPFRIDSLGEDYTEAAIRARLGKEKVRAGGGDSGTRTQVSLLVDIQSKIREGKGAGYEQWAKIFNLKQAAKTLIYLQEQGIDSYEDLKKKSSSASGEFAALNSKIKDVETRQKEIAELQKYIGQYGKTRAVYDAYKQSGWSAKFFEVHRAEITLHKAAKKFFDGLKLKKLPSINQLKQEYATLSAEKKKLYSDYHAMKENSRALTVAKHNADRLLGVTPQTQTHDVSHEQSR